MRDEVALSAFYGEILDAYPSVMRPFAVRIGVSMDQLRYAVRGLIQRERDGDIRATAELDQFQAAMHDWQARGYTMPFAEGQDY